MGIIPETAAVTAAAQQPMPRFADCTINMQEPIGRMPETLVNETMGAEAEQLYSVISESTKGDADKNPYLMVAEGNRNVLLRR